MEQQASLANEAVCDCPGCAFWTMLASEMATSLDLPDLLDLKNEKYRISEVLNK